MKISKEKLNIILARKGLSFTDMARRMKVDVTMISKINKDFDRFRPKTIGKIAKALDVDVTELLED